MLIRTRAGPVTPAFMRNWGEPMKPTRILLVDDHTLLRAGLRALLEAESDFSVIGEAPTGEQGVELALELRPDIVVMDLSMPGEGGLEATRRIIHARIGTRVLVLTLHADTEHLMPVLEAGASGYVTKHSADRELVEAIRTVANDGVFLYAGAARALTQRLRAPVATVDDPLERLSVREKEVLHLTAEGYSSTEIGERLQLSHKTVETYRQRLMEKLNLHHRSELIRLALRCGLLVA
jgi:DNA-binding NarL/FixJ family response regulator